MKKKGTFRMKTLTLSIEGMHCGGCVNRVTNVLKKLDSVEIRRVEVGSAEVAYDEAKTTAQAIADSISGIGFPARGN